MKHDTLREEGISTAGVLVALLVLVSLGLGGFSIYSYMNYRDQKNNTDVKINAAVIDAKKVQKDEDDKVNAEREKAPDRQFNGPNDLGSVQFVYPKTWSVYIGNGDGSGSGSYTAYLNPGIVPTVTGDQQYALHLKVENKDYEAVLKSYDAQVKKGALKSSILTTNGLSGTRLDGSFAKNIDGSAGVFKVRDKTLTIQTDSPTYRSDFDNIVIKSLTFTP